MTDVPPEAVARAGMLAAKLDAHQQCIASDGAKGARAVLDGEDLRPIANLLVGGGHVTGLSACRVLAIGLTSRDVSSRARGSTTPTCANATSPTPISVVPRFRNAKLAHANFENADLDSLRLPDGTDMPADFTGSSATKSRLFSAILETILWR